MLLPVYSSCRPLDGLGLGLESGFVRVSPTCVLELPAPVLRVGVDLRLHELQRAVAVRDQFLEHGFEVARDVREGAVDGLVFALVQGLRNRDWSISTQKGKRLANQYPAV